MNPDLNKSENLIIENAINTLEKQPINNKMIAEKKLINTCFEAIHDYTINMINYYLNSKAYRWEKEVILQKVCGADVISMMNNVVLDSIIPRTDNHVKQTLDDIIDQYTKSGDLVSLDTPKPIKVKWNDLEYGEKLILKAFKYWGRPKIKRKELKAYLKHMNSPIRIKPIIASLIEKRIIMVYILPPIHDANPKWDEMSFLYGDISWINDQVQD